MKKFILLLIILLSSFFLTGLTGSAENPPANPMFSRKSYIGNLIYRIEDESGVEIPYYIDFKYVEYIYNLATELEVPIRLVFRLVKSESTFYSDRRSPEGAEGFFQVMPDTRKLYVKKHGLDTLQLDNNEKNIYIGLHELRSSYDYWISKGNSEKYAWKLSLACYNAGIVAVKKYNGIPPYEATRKYIAYIMKPVPKIIETPQPQSRTYTAKK